MVIRANRNLWVLCHLNILGDSPASLVDVYDNQIRSILEFGVPVWHGGITESEKADIERGQKYA